MVLNAHAGTKYGIPFPVFCRAAFGTRGANVPALLRALVACGWFGIQTWIGGNAIFKILGVFVPALAHAASLPVLGISCRATRVCFLFFWGINVWIIYRALIPSGCCSRSRRHLLIVLGLIVARLGVPGGGRVRADACRSRRRSTAGQPKAGGFWKFFVPALTGMISFWATLSLNIPDFSRYAAASATRSPGRRSDCR